MVATKVATHDCVSSSNLRVRRKIALKALLAKVDHIIANEPILVSEESTGNKAKIRLLVKPIRARNSAEMC